MGYKTGIIALSLGSLILLHSFTAAKRSGRSTGIPELVESFHSKYPQQKVYLSMDKQAYNAGQNIWYKVYMLNATTHQADNLSKNLIVEINNSFGNNVLTNLCMLEGGLSRGSFSLPDTLPEGIYEIRAYTNWMRNFGDEYFFSKRFNIWNPEYAPKIYRNDKIANKKLKKKSIKKASNVDVQFFPEGGELLSGIASRVAFKAINDLGIGVDVEGILRDKKDRQVASFSSYHLGMGAFEFTPEKNMVYTAEVLTANGKSARYKLPKALEEGFSMRIDNLDQAELLVSVAGSNATAEVLLIGHIRGKVYVNKLLKLSDGTASYTVNKSQLPTGIIHLTLFDQASMPRCERLAFINNNNELNINIDISEKEYGIKDKVDVSLHITDSENRPVQGSFSLAVADRDSPNESSDFQSDIISHLFLTSDIRGKVQEPGYYFRNNNSETKQALDYLMMTQGWRRFVWDNVIETNTMQIDYPIERGLEVTGKVTKEFLDIPLKNLPVTLTVESEFNDVYISRTNNKGEFRFELPDYEDTISVEITARRLNGKKNLVIYIDQATHPETRILYSSYTKEMIIQGSKAYRPREEPKEDTNKVRVEGLQSNPDHVIVVDETLATYNSVFEIIQGRVPGVQVTGNSVQIRGPGTLYGSSEPLYLIDNVPVDAVAVASLNPMDIERIEFLKGPSAAIYGLRGANGVIAIFTRRGSFMRKGVLDFKMFGYHRAREFYSPKYGTEFDYLIEDYRSTVFWEPMVTTDETGTAEMSCFNSDSKGTFWVVVEGISQEGSPGHAEISYEVR